LFTPEELEAVVARGRTCHWGPLARAITRVENAPPWSVALPPADKPSHIVGITGPPGAGKSTLTGRLIVEWADAGLRVGVLAIDPSSPITGGAVLGDRLRMEAHLDGRPHVFVRSLASRGSHGAVASATRNVARLMECTGLFDVILVETVGAGQTEVAIVDLADTVVLVTVPGLGDAVQTIKAGLMEVADLFVVNMADRPGAAETSRHLRLAGGPSTVVLQTVASEGVGVDALMAAVDARWAALGEAGALADLRAAKWRSDTLLVAEAWLADCARRAPGAEGSRMAEAVADLLARSTDRWNAEHLGARDE